MDLSLSKIICHKPKTNRYQIVRCIFILDLLKGSLIDMMFSGRGFYGPFLRDSSIGSNVESRPGVYIITNNLRNVHYIGRSDNDVAYRIREAFRRHPRKYTKYYFRYETSPRNAYLTECRLWHRYQPDDNILHPDKPDYTNWKCPICK